MVATDDVLTPVAIEFLEVLAREFEAERAELLAARDARALALRAKEAQVRNLKVVLYCYININLTSIIVDCC